MSDLFYDPDTHDDRNRQAAEEAYDESAIIVEDAWEWAIDTQPEHLTPAIINAYRTSPDYATVVDDIATGERTIT